MGRSENSRNRVFVAKDGGRHYRTQAFDPAKLEDPSLIIYAPVRVLGKTTIVTNGDQTDTIYDHLTAGKSFAEALRTRTFEPDAPNFTPRISGMVKVKGGAMSYKLSILKSADGGNADSRASASSLNTTQPAAGEGRFIHTYRCDGNPHPHLLRASRSRCARRAISTRSPTWCGTALNEDNKVSLFVRYIDLAGNQATDTKTADRATRHQDMRRMFKDMANELELKYGCNPNQKPVAHLHAGGRAAHRGAERQTGLYQFPGRVQQLAAGKRAEGRPPACRRPRPSSTSARRARRWACR